MQKIISVKNVKFSNRLPIVLIAGPCVIESRGLVLKVAKQLKAITTRLKVPFIFKASYDKANRTSIDSFRGPGLQKGLAILKEVKETLGLPILTDVHSVEEVAESAKVADILQIPAFLCRQTDLVVEAGRTGKAVNIKKGQFLDPHNMGQLIRKVESTGNKKIILTERGVSFGYGNLVSDFRSLAIMAETGYPVVFDATHSVQQPGGLGHASGGCREFIPLLARCAVAAGCAGIFLEVHPNPEKALSDGPNMIALSQVEKFLTQLKKLDSVIKNKV
ncbi:MAG: 3-deoxy-8-phosphooctulonate synthase [Candidatus Omnitrophica bacterium]|nr:3-deoxy-8-phosphooctulonate synthase [Candidatus Omnitrophota bacterium]